MTPTFSFEVFPVKTEEGQRKLLEVIQKLAEWQPAFISVADTSGQDDAPTLQLVRDIRALGLDVVPHLTGIGRTRDDIRQITEDLQAAGVTRILALRGDQPRGDSAAGDFPHATDLIQFLKEIHAPFQLGAACYPDGHPEAKNRADDFHWLKQKEEEGAEFLISQMCAHPTAILTFLSEARTHGVTIPILPGVLAATRTRQAQDIRNKIDVNIPDGAFGIEQAVSYCRALMEGGVQHFHFFTLNETAADEICRQLVAISPSFR